MINTASQQKPLMIITCCACSKDASTAWSTLNNYFGLTGSFCMDCYNKVSHDAYGNPNNPGEYVCMLLKCGAKK